MVDILPMHERIRGGVIVSCQAVPGDPTYSTEMMIAFAQSAQIGGAVGIRANGQEFIRAIKNKVNLPLLGIMKMKDPDGRVLITGSVEDALNVIEAGADMVAVDATDCWRPHGVSVKELLVSLKHETKVSIVAEVETLSQGLFAEEWGADFVSTTLAVDHMPPFTPDFDLLKNLTYQLHIPVIMEGNIWTIKNLRHAFDLGACSVVIGSAITRPWLVTKYFVDSIKG